MKIELVTLLRGQEIPIRLQGGWRVLIDSPRK